MPQPTPEQLRARLNPTPATIQTPSAGMFRDISGGAQVFVGNKSIDLVGALLSPEERTAAGNYGAQSAIAQQRFQQQYGTDFNSLQGVNMGDYMQQQNRTWTGGAQGFQFQAGGLADLGTAKATLSASQINTQPNALASQADILRQQQNPAWQNAIAQPNRGGNVAGQMGALSSDPRLEQMRQQLLGGQQQLNTMQQARNAPPTGTTGTTGTTGATGTGDLSAQELAVQNAMQSSPESVETQRQLDALTTQAGLLQRGQQGQNIALEGQPIALPFITGQQASLEKSYALERGINIDKQQTLQQQLTRQQALRQSSLDVSKFNLERADKARETVRQTSQFAQTLAANAAKAEDGYKPPTSYQEWVLAGKPGTYADYLKDSSVKAPTVSQQTVSTYASRIEQANPILGNLTDKISKMSLVNFEIQRRLHSSLQSADFQSFDQAARNFINAVLRRESGAVISQSEFDNAYRQYLPRSGDTAQTLAQKKTNRDITLASYVKSAGAAHLSLENLLGTGGAMGGNNPLGI